MADTGLTSRNVDFAPNDTPASSAGEGKYCLKEIRRQPRHKIKMISFLAEKMFIYLVGTYLPYLPTLPTYHILSHLHV